MNIESSQFLSSMQINEAYLNKQNGLSHNETTQKIQNQSFEDVLKNKIESERGEVKFSKHALNRLEDRNITLSDIQISRLNEASEKAFEKGIKDSLVMVDELAFILNVPNNTIITAIDSKQADEKIFTNIDGAVIA